MRQLRAVTAAAQALVITLTMSSSSGNARVGRRNAESPARSLVRGADLVLLHGRIWTGEPYAGPGEKPGPAQWAEALAAMKGRIVAVGGDADILAYIGPDTKQIDLRGRFAMPGFIDEHVHFVDGSFQLLQVNLKLAPSESEFASDGIDQLNV